MIFLGFTTAQKDDIVTRYCADHGIVKVYQLAPAKFAMPLTFPNAEHIEWAGIIQYKYFYRLLSEIDKTSLIVVNECLRTQDRNDLTYNCMRHFLQQAGHQIIFQYLPIIDSIEDFMILFDLDTRSQWKREAFRPELLREASINIRAITPNLHPIAVEASVKDRETYTATKAKLFAELGLKDPHTLPRNLHLVSGKAKLRHVQTDAHYIGRNNRFKLPDMQTYKEGNYVHAPYTVFEFCHNFIDFVDFLSLSKQTEIPALVADLKADQWYFDRYQRWLGRLSDAYSALR